MKCIYMYIILEKKKFFSLLEYQVELQEKDNIITGF